MPESERRLFVDFEGIDGSGKTTLSNRVADLLREQGYTVHHIRDKGVFRSEISKKIRKMGRDPHNVRMSDTAEMLLYTAREAQMVEEYVKPRWQDGAIIFSDRYLYSVVAHSCFGRGLDRDVVERVIDMASQGIWPDVVFYSDVDSLTSRVRKRIGKIRERRLGDFGRKGLMGIGFRERMRDGFLEMARGDTDRWLVIDNAHSTIDQSVKKVYDHLCDVLEAKGFGRPKPLPEADGEPPPEVVDVSGLARDPERDAKVCREFYSVLDGLARNGRPELTAYYVLGLDSPEAYALRETVLDREAEIVAYGLRGLKSPASMELRRRLLGKTPFHVARSLFGARKPPEVFSLRKDLVKFVPKQVALSIRGMDLPEAWDLRERLMARAPAEVLASLRGIDTRAAWAIRERALGKKNDLESLAESLGGVDSERAWEVRELLSEECLPWVLMSLRGLRSERSWEWRERYVGKAPKTIVRTIGRRDTPEAWSIREKVKTFAKEVLDSVSGLDCEAAWRLRMELRDRWPNTAVSSLGAQNQSERAWGFRWEQLERHPGNVLLLKHLAKAAHRAKEATEMEVDEED